MLKIFVSSTSRDLKEFREVLLDEIGKALDGVGMEFFVPRGEGSQKDSIEYLKRCDIVIFLITSYYGSFMDICELEENCKAECPMKTEKKFPYTISFTHCEYKTTIAENILHQTYLIGKDWELIDFNYLEKIPENEFDLEKIKELEIFKEISRPLLKRYYKASKLRAEVSNEAYGRIEQILIPETVNLIKKNLADQIIEWHKEDKVDFEKFVDREEVFNELIENIDNKVEVWGIGGIGKTALIQVALLIQKLKGKKIISVGTSKAYASGSGLEDFRTKCKDEQHIADSHDVITIYDIINAFNKNGLLPNAEEVSKLARDEKIAILSNKIRSEKNLILFIDDFHLATEDVVEVAKSVDNLILSSRKNTYIARKEIYLSGIDEEDRKKLIQLFSIEIPENVMKLINKIAEGHPVSTEVLVKNYENIDFDKLKDFDLTDADDNQVRNFYERVIEEIFSNNPEALNLLKNLGVLNIDLPTNINRESVLNSYDIENSRKAFKALVNAAMLKKREGKEGIYEFYFKHIQDYLEDIADKDNHEYALKYYEKKRDILKDEYNINDDVEILYHKVKSNPTEELVDEILEVNKKIQPVHYGFKRLIDIGEIIKNSVLGEQKAKILFNLGDLYQRLFRFEIAEDLYIEALILYTDWAESNPEKFLPDVARIQTNLAFVYRETGKIKKSKNEYGKVLRIYNKLSISNPEDFLPYVARIENTLKLIDTEFRRLEGAEEIFHDSKKIQKRTAEIKAESINSNYFKTLENILETYKKQDDARAVASTLTNIAGVYVAQGGSARALVILLEVLEILTRLGDFPRIGTTQINLGSLYYDLGRVEEAELAYQEALNIYKGLAKQSPEAYLPKVAITLNNLGILYRNLGRLRDAEKAYLEALEIYKELAEKSPSAYLPDVATTQNNLGVLYGDLGRIEDAEKAHLKALEIYKELAEKSPSAYLPDVAATQNNLGVLYINSRSFEKAVIYINEALEIDPNYSYAWYNKACLESLRNNQAQALEFLKKAIELDSECKDSAKTDEYFDNIRESKEFRELIGE